MYLHGVIFRTDFFSTSPPDTHIHTYTNLLSDTPANVSHHVERHVQIRFLRKVLNSKAIFNPQRSVIFLICYWQAFCVEIRSKAKKGKEQQVLLVGRYGVLFLGRGCARGGWGDWKYIIKVAIPVPIFQQPTEAWGRGRGREL